MFELTERFVDFRNSLNKSYRMSYADNFYIQQTPKYEQTYSFPNDFPALLEDVPSPPNSEDELFIMDAARGSCKVMCFHPKSNMTIALMSVSDIKEVISQ